ncbi:MAG: hypothetical protein U0R50_06810 [Gaiellales bacterium]
MDQTPRSESDLGTLRAERRREPARRSRGILPLVLVLLIAAATAAGVGAWLLRRDDGGASKSEAAKPVAATVADLEALATQVAHPVYWAGERPNTTYELTHIRDGRIYIRYLPSGTKVGATGARYTTIGTYPKAGAYAQVLKAASEQGAKVYNTRTGALVVQSATSPTSVYFAFKGTPYLIEVFDPSAAKALELALSGDVKLVPAG